MRADLPLIFAAVRNAVASLPGAAIDLQGVNRTLDQLGKNLTGLEAVKLLEPLVSTLKGLPNSFLKSHPPADFIYHASLLVLALDGSEIPPSYPPPGPEIEMEAIKTQLEKIQERLGGNTHPI